MSEPSVQSSNVTGVAALLMVTSMERSLKFYVEGLGFTIQNRWIPDGHLRWVWMSLGSAALMLQEANGDTPRKLAEAGKLGNGSSLYFQCKDALALYREAGARGIHPRHEPQVGNFCWEIFYQDPDGYHINFSSPTDLPEETLLSEIEAARPASRPEP